MISKKLLKDYAELLAKVGLNVQKGQDVYLVCELDQIEFIEILVKTLYKAGARKVIVDLNHQKLTALEYKFQKQKTLNEFESFEVEKLKWRAEKLPCHLYVISEDPEGLAHINNEKLTARQVARYPIIKPFRKAMENKYQWCIAAVPGKAWAKRVFPTLNEKKAVERLWEAILSSCMVDGNALENWSAYNKKMRSRCEYLNSLNLASLHYTSSNGTNLKVGLNELGTFKYVEDKTLQGINYVANIPSQEVFTSPKRGECEGIVYSTKPLSFKGNLIDNFSIEFKGGKVTSVKAEKGQDLLEKMVKMDEGSSMLGECALVPFDNPINESGILFFETLFDENACCHLALGEGFSDTLKGYETMTDEEFRKNGINESMIHVDFMIGSRDLKIVGETRNGEKVLIFENGNFANDK